MIQKRKKASKILKKVSVIKEDINYITNTVTIKVITQTVIYSIIYAWRERVLDSSLAREGSVFSMSN